MKMKTKIIGLTVLLFGLGLSLWTACDKIADDEMRTGPQKIAPYDPDEDVPIVDTLQYIVLEDFTGVRCVNCPDAATIAHTLQAQYRHQLILIELHPENSSLTKPYTGDADLRNASAQTYYAYWNSPALPKGLVCRRQASAMDKDDWTGAVETMATEKPVATVNEVSATLADNKITVAASGYFHEDYTAAGGINMIVMVLEDGFSVRQEGNAESKEAHNYAHNHVLRATIGDAWGTAIDVEPKAGQTFELPVASNAIAVDEAWNTDKLSVVVMLTDADTRAILNAAKVKVKK